MEVRSGGDGVVLGHFLAAASGRRRGGGGGEPGGRGLRCFQGADRRRVEPFETSGGVRVHVREGRRRGTAVRRLEFLGCGAVVGLRPVQFDVRKPALEHFFYFQ